MRWLVITDELNILSKPAVDLLQCAGQTILLHEFQNLTNKKQIEDLIQKDKPDRIILIVTNNSQTKLKTSIHDYLIIPISLAQITCQTYSNIPFLILTIDNSNDDLNILQNALDQLVNMFSHILK